MKRYWVAGACLALIWSSQALAKPDSLKTVTERNQAGEEKEGEPKGPSLYLSGEYVAAGAVDSRPLNTFTKRTSSLEAGIEYKVELPNPAWTIGLDAGAGIDDDRLSADEDGSKLKAGGKVSWTPNKAFVPFVKIEVEQGYDGTFGDRQDRETAFSAGVDFAWNLPRDVAFKLSPSAARVESTNRDDDAGKFALDLAVEGMKLGNVDLEVSGGCTWLRSRHDMPGLGRRLRKDGFEAGLAVGFVDVLKKVSPSAGERLKWLEALKLQVKWVTQDSNSGKPDDTYSRWQFVPGFKLSRPLWPNRP